MQLIEEATIIPMKMVTDWINLRFKFCFDFNNHISSTVILRTLVWYALTQEKQNSGATYTRETK